MKNCLKKIHIRKHTPKKVKITHVEVVGILVHQLVQLFIGETATGLDLVTALSGSAQAVANVGPGLGPIIGPAGNFAPLSDPAKWLLSLGMLLGRLELFTVLVLLQRGLWRW